MKYVFQIPVKVHAHDEKGELHHKSNEVLLLSVEAENIDAALGVVRVSLGQVFGTGVVGWRPLVAPGRTEKNE